MKGMFAIAAVAASSISQQPVTYSGLSDRAASDIGLCYSAQFSAQRGLSVITENVGRGLRLSLVTRFISQRVEGVIDITDLGANRRVDFRFRRLKPAPAVPAHLSQCLAMGAA
jgi:hypothetical protein